MSIVSLPSVTQDQVDTALRGLIMAMLPDGVEVISGQPNRVPEPASPDFVVFTPMGDTRLSTTIDMYDTDADTLTMMEPVQTSYQLDIHGPNSTDNARTLKLVWRSLWACDKVTVFKPLYASDGSQRPFINGEGQYEDRWVLTIEMQINPSVVTPQEFADNVDVELLPVFELIP